MNLLIKILQYIGLFLFFSLVFVALLLSLKELSVNQDFNNQFLPYADSQDFTGLKLYAYYSNLECSGLTLVKNDNLLIGTMKKCWYRQYHPWFLGWRVALLRFLISAVALALSYPLFMMVLTNRNKRLRWK